MPQHYWWIIEQESRALIEARLAEAERDRLARRLAVPRRSTRAALAGALRAIAERLDGEAMAVGERQLSPVR